jgi:hypothetical protein
MADSKQLLTERAITMIIMTIKHRFAKQWPGAHPLASVLRATLVVLLTVTALPASALETTHEVDRLLLVAQQEVEAKRFDQAKMALDKIASISSEWPAHYFYYRGLVQADAKLLDAARQSLESYVTAVGRRGEHYEAALIKITALENQSAAPRAQRTVQPSISWATEEQQKTDYVGQLQFLYQEQSEVSALLSHINNLLDFYGYGDTAITAANRIGATTRYKLATLPGAILVTQKREQRNSGELLTNTKLKVYGVNPYVGYQCRTADQSCTVEHPETKGTWLQIVNNEEAVQELAKALSELIKRVQKAG